MRLYLLAAVFVAVMACQAFAQGFWSDLTPFNVDEPLKIRIGDALMFDAQGPARLQRNPRGVAFLCPDHDIDDGHELDIIEQSTGKVIQTLNLGDPPLNAAGEVVADVKVQPLKVGVYSFKVRAKVGAIQSEDSDAYVWERAPGRPTIVAQ